jgi:hypothetical protein
MKCGKLLLNRAFEFNWAISFVGAASSRDKRRQHGAAAIFAAGSRSHQVKTIFLQKKCHCSVIGVLSAVLKTSFSDNMLSDKTR